MRDGNRGMVRKLHQLIQRPELQGAEFARAHAIRILPYCNPRPLAAIAFVHGNGVVLRHFVRARLETVLASYAYVRVHLHNPMASFEMAPAGHTLMQLGSSQCMHEVEMKKLLPLRRLNEDTVLLSGVSSDRSFSFLHASTHRPHPEHRARATRKPYAAPSPSCRWSASRACASPPEAATPPRTSAQVPAADACNSVRRVTLTCSPISNTRFQDRSDDEPTLQRRTPRWRRGERPCRPP